jgi:tetratricopeptide (TPR) repeat protein
VEAFKQAIRFDPDNAEALFELAVTYDDLGQDEDAIAAYLQATRIDPNYHGAFLNLGRAYERQDRTSEAIAAYREAIKIKPDYVQAYNNLGTALTTMGDQEEAVTMFKQAIKIKPDYAPAHHNLGTIYRDKGGFEDAEKCFQQALRSNPEQFQSYVSLARTYVAMMKYDEAFGALESLDDLEVQEVSDGDVHFDAAKVYLSLGSHKKAIESIKKGLRLLPKAARARYDLGLLCLEVGDKAGAKEQYEELKNLNPHLAEKLSNEIKKQNPSKR